MIVKSVLGMPQTEPASMFICVLQLIHATIFTGVLQADPGTVRDYLQIFRLFCHEAQRVFHDRLINDEDKRYFNTILAEMSQKHFSQVGWFVWLFADVLNLCVWLFG